MCEHVRPSCSGLTRCTAIPRFLRVRELVIDKNHPGRQFVKCSCQERTKIGVPCPCFFRVARDASIPFEEIMDIGMFDVRYTKLFNSHYASKEESMAKMVYEAQAVCDCLPVNNLWRCIASIVTSHSCLHVIYAVTSDLCGYI